MANTETDKTKFNLGQLVCYKPNNSRGFLLRVEEIEINNMTGITRYLCSWGSDVKFKLFEEDLIDAKEAGWTK